MPQSDRPDSAAMDEPEHVHPLDANNLPELMDVTELEALEYVCQLLEDLISLHEQETPADHPRKHSYDQALETSHVVLSQLVPQPAFQREGSPVLLPEDPEHTKQKAEELYKRFWLKEPPPISVHDYLHRFHRYCRSSAATYLTAGCLIHMIAVQLKAIPVTQRNAYRLFCAAFIVSAKFIEDRLYSMSRYATTAGLMKQELARLELSLLLVLNFDIKADREVLKANLQNWALLNQNSGSGQEIVS